MEILLKRPAVRAGLALLSLAALAAVFFGDGLFGDSRTLIWDSADQQFAYLNLVSRLWRSGQLPVWNPFLFNGYPMIGEPVYQIFYPPNLLMTIASSFSPRAILFQLALHQVLGGFFTYLLAGLWLKSTPARLLAGVVYMLNGCFWARQEHVVTIDTEIWLPLVLYAVERAWRARTAPSLAFAGSSIALLILAGHPQSFYFSLLVVSLTTVYWVAEAHADRQGPAWRPLAVFGAAVVLGVLLCGVQLVPTLEFLRLTNRGGAIPYQLAIASGALRPSHLVTAFLPDFHGALRGPYLGEGDVSQSTIYFGAVPLLLAGFVLSGRPGRRRVYLLVMATLALLISMGPNGFVSPLFYRVVPMFGTFRSPANYVFVFVLFAALLAGSGLERLQRNEVRLSRYAGYLAALGLALWILVRFVAPPKPRLAANLGRGELALAASFLAVVALVALRRARLLGASACGWLAVGLASIELVATGVGALTLGDRSAASTYCEENASPLVTAAGGLPGQGCRHPDPPVVDEGRAAPPYRLHVDSQVYSDASPVPSTMPLYKVGFDRSLLHHLYLTDGYEPMVLRQHVAFHRLVQRLSLETAGQPPGQKAAVLGRPLRAAAVRYILLPTGLVEIPDPLPRAYFVESARTAPDEAGALRLLGDPAVDLRSEVIVERDGPDEPQAAPSRWAPVRFLSETAASASLSVQAPHPGYVVFSDTFYPGWEASVNGRSAPVLRANQSFKAVRVDAGLSEVRFNFRPRSLRWGALLTLLTLLLGGGFLMIGARRRAKR